MPDSSGGGDNVLTFDSESLGDDRGMYGMGDESMLEETAASEEDLIAMISSGDTSTVYPSIPVTNVANETNPFFNIENGKAQILGLPFSFNKMADPDGRVFRETIMNDLPLLFVVPGKTVLNSKLVSMSDGNKWSASSLLNLLNAGVQLTDIAFGVKGARSGNDLRFLGFKADYSEFFRYVQTALSVVYSLMGLEGVYDFANSFDEGGKGLSGVRNHGLTFYMDKSTSISEGNSNDYTQTSIAQRANDLSAQNREAKLLLGINTAGDTTSWAGKAMNLLATSVGTLAEGITSVTGILSGMGNVFGRVVNGSQLLYPEIWADSAVDKSYTLSFKFASPYADKESIFEYVYVPLVVWICLSYPRQDNVLGYGQPFVMRLICEILIAGQAA